MFSFVDIRRLVSLFFPFRSMRDCELVEIMVLLFDNSQILTVH